MSEDIPQHKSMAQGKMPGASGPPTKEKYKTGGPVKAHGHGKGAPGHGSHGHKKMPGK